MFVLISISDVVGISTECLCMLPGTHPIDVPVVPKTLDLVNFNVLFALLFAVLSDGPAMSALKVSPRNTISSILEQTFPAIPSTDNKPTPLVTPKLAGYIQALIIDSVTHLHSDTAYQRALRCENVIVQGLQELPLDKFKSEFRIALTSYYEGILSMPGADGSQAKVTNKRKVVCLLADEPTEETGNNDAAPAPEEGAAAPAAAAGAEPAAAAAATPETEDASEVAATPPPAKKAGRGGKAGRT